MRVLALTKYSSLGASSRLRTHQFVPWLRSKGVDVQVSELFDDVYIKNLYAKKRAIGNISKAYWRRLLVLTRAKAFDVVWLEKEALPWLPSGIEVALLPGTKMLVDYDDAVFHRYDLHRSGLVRSLLGRKIDRVMRQASVVTVGNDYLGARARSAGCRCIEWIPTVVDIERYPKPQRRGRVGPTVVGWIGSPSTAPYLAAVAPALEPLVKSGSVRCVAIGARPDQVSGTPFVARPWTVDGEVASLSDLDIGIMPLHDGPWERGKCGYKLIQYMACGLPVVASSVGINNQLVREGENGFLASGVDSWSRAIARLVSDAHLRVRMGENGRARVEQVYCLQVQGPRLLKILQEMAEGSLPGASP